MAENNGANFNAAAGEWYYQPEGRDYSGNVTASELAAAQAAHDARAPVPTVPQSRTSASEPAVRVNTQPAPSQRDVAPVWQPVKPPNADQRQQANVQTSHAGREYFDPLTLPITEEDQPLFASFATVLAKHNVSPTAGKDIFDWYQNMIATGDRAQAAADEQQRRTNAAALQREWGSNFTKNCEECFRLIDHLTDVDTADAIFNARDPSGQLLGNNPGFLRWLHSVVGGRNSPNAQVAAGYGGGNVPTASDEAELASIRKMMANDRSEYWYGKNAATLQQRYRELISRNV